MTEEAEFARTFGEDAEHVEIPENILAGESFLDMCLASSTYVSTRKISVKWRGETFSVNTATEQKYEGIYIRTFVPSKVRRYLRR